MCPTFCQRNDVVDFLDRNKNASLEALFTERVLLHVTSTDPCPRSSVPTAYRSVASVLLVGLCVFLRVLRAEPLAWLHKLWASRVSTRMLWFVRHLLPPFPGITKPRKGLVLRGCARPLLYSFLIIHYIIGTTCIVVTETANFIKREHFSELRRAVCKWNAGFGSSQQRCPPTS